MKQRLLEVAFVAAPKFLTGALTVALNAALLRYLGPSEYGVFALCAAAIVLFDSIVGAAVDNSMFKLVQAERHLGAAHGLAIQRSALAVKALLWVAGCAVVGAFAGEVSRRWFHQEGREGLMGLVLLAAGCVLVFRSLLAHWQMRERFLAYGGIDLTHTFLKFGSIAALLAMAGRAEVETLVGLLALAPAVVVAGAFVAGAFPLLPLRPDGAGMRRVAGEARWFLLTYGLSVVLSRLDLFLLAALSTIEEVGIYSGGQVFAVIPEMVGSLLSVVFVPRIYAFWRAGRLAAHGRTLALAGIALAAAVMGAAWLARPALAAIFPPAFQSSLAVFLILLPGYLGSMVAFPLVIPFLMFASPRAIFVLDVVTLPAVVALYAWLISTHGAVGMAWAATLTRLAKVAAMHAIAWRVLRRMPTPPAGAAGTPA